MSHFDYEGRTISGSSITGRVEAETEAAAANQLLSRGITPIKIKIVAANKDISLEEIREKFGSAKVPVEELIMFSRQMYRLTKAGVSVLASMKRLSVTTRCRPLSRALYSAAETIASGKTLGQALAEHPKVFSSLYINIIEVGETTGRVDTAFSQVMIYLQLENKTVKQVKKAMRYPMFVIATIIIAVIVINVVVLPGFSNMFAKFDAQLPLPTRILLAMSQFTVKYGYILLFIFVGTLVWFLHWIQNEPGRIIWDRTKTRLPVVGRILRKIILARFTRSFAMMMNAGVPILKGINLAAWSVDNAYYAREIIKLRVGFEKGESLSRVATNSQLFTPLVLQMLEVGEESGSLEEMLQDVAEYYEAEVDYALEGLSASIEPILLSVIAAMVLILALGIFLPMWDMMGALQGR